MKPPRFISAGSIPVQVNPRAAMATGAALAGFGQTIAQIGQQGFEVATRLRVVDEARKTEDLFSQFEEEANKFTIGLMTRHDAENWPTEWNQLSNDFKSRAAEKGLSPDGMDRFHSQFQDWNTRRTIHLETVAANKTIEMAKATFENSIDSHLSNQNYDGAITSLDNAAAAGLMSPPEREKALRQIYQTQEWNNHLEDIRTDPSWLDKNTEPPPGMDETKFNQLKNHAQATRSERNREGADGLLSNIITGSITKPEEIDEQGSALSPIVRHTLKEKLADFLSDAHKRRAQSPEGVQSIVGEVSSLIADYDPADEEQADAHYIRIASAISQLPTDSPIAKELTRQARAIRANTWQERDTVQSAALGALDDAFKAGRFGPTDAKPTPAMSTEKAINDGFLRDKTKLSALGFSEDQIGQLFAPVVDGKIESPPTDKNVKERFQKLWEYRAGDDSKASPFARATARAIVDGDADIIDLSPEAQGSRAAALESSRQKFGKMKIELSDWMSRNPKATEAEVTEKVTSLAGATARASIKASLLKPRPTSTSYTMPSKGIKLSNYGYPSDTTPDSNSARGIGHSDNKLIPGKSAAITKSLATKLGVKHGDKLKIKTTKGDFEVFYHDTVPSTDKRTGPLPETIDIYRPKDGSNSWGGRVLGISKL